MKYTYWIESKNGGLGEALSLKEAKEQLATYVRIGLLKKGAYRIVRHKAVRCPTCNRWTADVLVDQLGNCMGCEHVKGDLD